MAKDDFHVIAYRILVYLYGCMKEGESVDWDYFEDKHAFPINEKYMVQIFEMLLEEGYIAGIAVVKRIGAKNFKETDGLRITLKGIDYLKENSTIAKAKEFLADIKAIVPGM